MHKNSGFSLIELLVAIAIISIIISFGLPSLLNYRQKANLGKGARDIYGGLQRAKIEAARSNNFCVFSSTPGGFHVFEDRDRNYKYDWNADPTVSDRLIISFKLDDYPGAFIDDTYGGGDGMTFPDIDGAPTIAFAPDGLPKNPDNSLSNGSLFFHDGGKNGREVRVSPVGTIQIVQYEANH